MTSLYEIHSEINQKLSAVHRDTERIFHEIEETEGQDYVRLLSGALEAYSRRQNLYSRIVEERKSAQVGEKEQSVGRKIATMERDWEEAGTDLKRDLKDLKDALKTVREDIARKYACAMQGMSEEMRKVWSEAADKILSISQ